MRIKVCGITRARDAADAVRAGFDAIGLQFVERSPRRVTIEQAIEIGREIPPFVSLVGVFLDADREMVLRVAELAGLDYVQLHGSESPAFVESIPLRCIKTVGVASSSDLIDLDRFPADAILLDTKIDGRVGGSGKTFDWKLLDGISVKLPLVLAGGLRVENVVQAIRLVKPKALDLCTGVESNVGIKSFQKMCEFVSVVRDTDPNP
jgi:phosphoribosylanthranilate isomerase